MAKKIQIDIEVNGKMQKATVSTKKLKDALDGVDTANKKTSKSTGRLDRNLKGTADVSANATKNFSKMSQGMGGLVGIYATIAAQVFAVSAAFQLFKSATDFRNLIAGQEALGASSGIAYKTITQGIQNATDAQLGYAEAARAAAIGTSAGLSPSQLTELGRAAKNASVALGRDLGDSFDRLVRGVVKAEPEVLDELGIILRLAPATEKYALSIKKSAQELTAFERSQAVANEVLEQAEDKFGLIEAQLDPTVASLNQFLKAFDDVKKSIFEAIAGPIATFAKFLSENITALIGVLSLFGLSVLKQIIPNLTAWRESSRKTIDLQKTKLAELRTELDATKLKYQEINASQANFAQANTLLGGKKAPTTGALGFIAGGTDSKQARGAALRAFKHYKDQTLALEKGSIKLRTGVLKKFNADQILMLEQVYAARVAINAKTNADFKSSIEGQKLMMRQLGLEAEIVGAQAIGITGKLASVGAKLLSALGWVGLAVSLFQILVGVGSSIVKIFSDIDERQEAANKKVQESIDKYKTLNEELLRTQSFLDENFVAGMTSAVAEAGSVQSLDIKTLIKDINLLNNKRVKASDGFDELKNKMLATAKTAALLSPEFKKLVDAIENGTVISEANAEALEKVARQAGTVKTAFAQAAAVTGQTNSAIEKLISTASKPFGTDVLSAINSEMDNTRIRVASLLPELTELRDNQVTLREVGPANVKVFDDPQAPEGILPYKGNEERFAELQEASQSALNKTEKEFDALIARSQEIFRLQTALTTAIDSSTAATKEQNTTLVEAATLRTNGLTLEGKLANIQAAGMERSVNTVGLENKKRVQLALQQALLNEVNNDEEKLSSTQKLQLAQARLAIAESQREIDLLEIKNDLADALVELETKRAKLQDKITDSQQKSSVIQATQKIEQELQREFNLRTKIAALKLEEAKKDAQFTVNEAALENPFLNKEREMAKATLALEKATYTERFLRAETEYANRLTAINLEYQLLEAQKEANALKMESIAIEAKSRGKDDIAKDATAAAASFRSINYEGAKKAAEDLALATKNVTQAGLKRLLRDAERLVIELQPISIILNDAAKSFSTALTDSFTTIFDSLTDKTMDLKEALKSIGRSFVSSLQKSLVENMLVGPLTEKIGTLFSKFKLKEKAAGLFGIKTKAEGEGTGAPTSIGGGLDGKGLGTTTPLLVRLESGASTLPGGTAQGTGGDNASAAAGGGSPPETKAVKEQTEATKQNTMATTQAGLQTATMALGAIATVAALTGNEKAAKKLAMVMALLQVAVAALEVAMYIQTAGSFFGFRRGGVASPNMYSTGGIAKGSHAGYPALLHGTEAVVPLPNGKSIPVEMGGAAGMQQNNVNVNVVVNRDGTAETNSEEDSREAARLGKNIARAVQTEIQNQKRAGGMLSPYGAL